MQETLIDQQTFNDLVDELSKATGVGEELDKFITETLLAYGGIWPTPLVGSLADPEARKTLVEKVKHERKRLE